MFFFTTFFWPRFLPPGLAVLWGALMSFL